MKLYLTKKNRITIDFILLETDDKLVRKSVGKVGKSGIANSTLNSGTAEKAIEEITKIAKEYRSKGFVDTPFSGNEFLADSIFDKAKYHYGGDFPSDIGVFQAYVPTGLFVCWLINNIFFDKDMKQEFNSEITLLKERNISPSTFYHDYLDGVFSSEGFTMEAINFANFYFDFEQGTYLNDYAKTLDPNDKLQTLYHIADTWENYDKLKLIIDTRFNQWKLSIK
jgi:hypothetical protein